MFIDIAKRSNVGMEIINHPPFITIFMGGIPTIDLMGGANDIAIPTLKDLLRWPQAAPEAKFPALRRALQHFVRSGGRSGNE